MPQRYMWSFDLVLSLILIALNKNIKQLATNNQNPEFFGEKLLIVHYINIEIPKVKKMKDSLRTGQVATISRFLSLKNSSEELHYNKSPQEGNKSDFIIELPQKSV